MKEIKLCKQYESIIQEYNLNKQFCKCFSFESGETFVHQGIKKDYLFFVLEGIINVQFIKEDGCIISLQYKKNDGVIGEMELFSDTKGASASVSAQTSSICLAYPYVLAKEEMKQNIQFVLRIAKDMANKLTGMTNAYALSQGQNGESRVCYFIVNTSINSRYRDTQKRIASETGISYRQISRILRKLCEENILKKEESGYTILNEKRLRKKAGLL